MATEIEIAWAAGLFEGEGCISTRFDYAALVVLLDLPEASTVDEQIRHLRERRRFQLEVLDGRDPSVFPAATLLRLRACRLEEVRVCELALEQLGASFDLPVDGGDE